MIKRLLPDVIGIPSLNHVTLMPADDLGTQSRRKGRRDEVVRAITSGDLIDNSGGAERKKTGKGDIHLQLNFRKFLEFPRVPAFPDI